MTTASIIKKLLSPEIRSVFMRNHVRHAYLTGSFARGDAKETSDLDIIYEKEVGASFTLFNIGDLKSSLEEAF
jgi:predicted nucleotidyltransferase